MKATVVAISIFFTFALGAQAQTPFSFQAAYDVAPPGATIQVPAGQVAVDWPGAGAATIMDGAKAITFVCADPSGLVTFDPAAPHLIIARASNVTLRGACFRFRNLMIGLGGDDAANTLNVVIDGVDRVVGSRTEGAEITGAKATIRNLQFGPSTLCYAQGTTGTGQNGGTITSAMWCDPSIPVEADYAAVGNDNDISNQLYVHNNSGGVPSDVVLENIWLHDIQTKDAFNLHTGCGQVWQGSGSFVLRDSLYERCAILGILFVDADNVSLERNSLGPPMEPFSNTGGAIVEAGDFAKEIICKEGDCVNWIVRGNTLCHGTRADGGTGSNVLFDSNDLGRADAPWPFATYVGNTNVGASCSGSPPPPPPPPPPPATQCSDGFDNDDDHLIDLNDPGCADAADDDETDPLPPSPPVCIAPVLTAGSQTDRTSTITWLSVPGTTGYRLYKNGVLISTAGSLATSVTFRSLPYGETLLGVGAICPDGEKLANARTIEARTVVIS